MTSGFSGLARFSLLFHIHIDSILLSEPIKRVGFRFMMVRRRKIHFEPFH
jgi:hypothetical protein